MSLYHNSEKGAPLGYMVRERGETLTRSVYGGGGIHPCTKIERKNNKTTINIEGLYLSFIAVLPCRTKGWSETCNFCVLRFRKGLLHILVFNKVNWFAFQIITNKNKVKFAVHYSKCSIKFSLIFSKTFRIFPEYFFQYKWKYNYLPHYLNSVLYFNCLFFRWLQIQEQNRR